MNILQGHGLPLRSSGCGLITIGPKRFRWFIFTHPLVQLCSAGDNSLYLVTPQGQITRHLQDLNPLYLPVKIGFHTFGIAYSLPINGIEIPRAADGVMTG